MPLLPIKHQQQKSSGDCLVACTSMALDYMGKPVDYELLSQLLGTTPDGTPFFNIERLASTRRRIFPKVHIESGQYGDLSLLQSYLDDGCPVIVGVTTFAWQHWHDQIVEHAVVVAGLDEQQVQIYDPAFADTPIAMSHVEFEIGWFEKDLVYAVIKDRT